MLQILKALSLLHGAGFLHRDLKPSNCCIGATDCLTRQYLDKGGIVRKPRAGVGLRGTIRYMSLDAHARHDLGPNTDLVAFLYSTIECGDGSLPWSREQTHENIIKLKQAHTGDKLCSKQPIFVKVAEYIESLNYHNIPDYEKLFALVEDCNPPDLKESEPYDWQYRQLPNPMTPTANETPGGTKENATERLNV
uniref:non-specific serine/threonine protein kinase n=1 Tax=Caenorhabditis tropicalis TaxID=1561998 RepID=A0A1I7T2E3_9PELO